MSMIRNYVIPQLSATSAPLREYPARGLLRAKRRRIALACWPIIALLAALMITGCSEPTVGTVSGTITVDGASVKSGSIAFFPVDGRSSTSGAEIVDGQYKATVAPGTAR